MSIHFRSNNEVDEKAENGIANQDHFNLQFISIGARVRALARGGAGAGSGEQAKYQSALILLYM